MICAECQGEGTVGDGHIIPGEPLPETFARVCSACRGSGYSNSAPEPVEVPAGELAAAARLRYLVGCGRSPTLPLSEGAALLAEYDRMRAELARLRAREILAECTIDALRADLARALPVVEAAGALVEHCWSSSIERGLVRSADGTMADLFDALARAYRAAREPRTGEQRG